jgi:hypothetical protein
MYRAAMKNLVAVICVALVPSLALAQPQPQQPPPPATVCTPGMAADASGYCCWPGQTWSEQTGHCVGAPHCPDGWAGDGNGCVRKPASGHEEIEPYHGQPLSPDARIEARHPRELVVSGALVLGAGFAGALGLGIYGMLAAHGDIGGGRCEGQMAWNLVPIAGPIVSAEEYNENYAGGFFNSPRICNKLSYEGLYAYGVTFTALQATGLSLLLAGVFTTHKVVVRQDHAARTKPVQWAVVPGSAGSQLGASLFLTGF